MSTTLRLGNPEFSPHELASIVHMRQTSLLENAFPEDTQLTLEQREAIIGQIPPLGGQALERLAFFAQNGQMKSLDLERTDLSPDRYGDWQMGAEIDAEMHAMLELIATDEVLRRDMGLVALRGQGIIGREDPRAAKESSVTVLGHEALESGYVTVTRRRTVGAFTLQASRQPIAIRKMSDFRLLLSDINQYATPRERAFRWLVINQISDKLPINYGDANDGMSALRKNVSAGIEAAIDRRASYLEPIAVSYHVVRHGKPLSASDVPLQRPASAS